MTSGMWYRAALRDDLIAARQVSMIREQFADALRVGLMVPASSSSLVTLQLEECARITTRKRLMLSSSRPPPDRACATLLVGTTND
jgi:hypothetical protein